MVARNLADFIFKTSAMVSIALALAMVAFFFIWYDFAISPVNTTDDGYYLLISPGTPAKQIVRQLHSDEIISHPKLFLLLIKAKNAGDKIHAGEYFIEKTTSPLELLDKLIHGKVLLHRFTIVEGWDLKRTVAELATVEALNNVGDYDSLLQKLKTKINTTALATEPSTLEGMFFPDTYKFPRNTSVVDLLVKSNKRMTELLLEQWHQRDTDLPYKNPYEALILASIIEKEAYFSQEKTKIARVFVSRLQKNMPLQADPTVIYGLQEKFDGNLQRKHLREKNPYNTYTNQGLPPTPIALPGLDSIYAALHPAATEALYFVARGDGSHYFSATLEQHNKAVAQYQTATAQRE